MKTSQIDDMTDILGDPVARDVGREQGAPSTNGQSIDRNQYSLLPYFLTLCSSLISTAPDRLILNRTDASDKMMRKKTPARVGSTGSCCGYSRMSNGERRIILRSLIG